MTQVVDTTKNSANSRCPGRVHPLPDGPTFATINLMTSAAPGMPRLPSTSPCLQKLDRLPWEAGLIFEAYGLRIGIRVNRAELKDRLRALLPPGARPVRGRTVDRLFSLWLGENRGRVRGFHLLYAGVMRRARTASLEEALETLESDLRLNVAAGARRHVFLHAGVVGWGGRAILVPGRSFSGKTALVSELVRAGAVYYSDEFAVLDGHGRVHPFAKPLSIREGSAIRRASAEEIGGISGGKALTVGAIVFAHYRAGARWRPQSLTPALGLLALLAHTVPIRRRPRTALRAIENAVRGAVVLKGPRGEAAVTARALLARFGAPAGALAEPCAS